ncbi:MAG: hypothetical protein PVI01_02125 [Gemmatimonadales bacterium]
MSVRDSASGLRFAGLVATMVFGFLACQGDAERVGIVHDTIGGVPSVMSGERGLLGDTVPWKLTQYLLVTGDQLFDRKAAVYAMDVGILPDGGVVVLDMGNRRVLRFGPDGVYLGSFGGPGDGPGQFVTPLFLEVAGDRIYVLDSALNRVTAFDTAGVFLSRFDIDLAGLAGTTPLFVAGGPDELYVAGEPVPFLTEVRDTGQAVIYRMNKSGAIVDTLALFLPSSWRRIEDAGGRSSFAKPRLAPTPRLSARPGVAALALGAQYMIEIRNPAGQLVRRVARQYDNVPVTPEIRDSVLDELSKAPDAMPREALELVPFAPVIPAVESLVMDDRGRLWVDVFAREVTRRDVFDAEGQFLGPLYLPQPIKLEDVSNDRACGLAAEPSGQSAVFCYRVTTGRR